MIHFNCSNLVTDVVYESDRHHEYPIGCMRGHHLGVFDDNNKGCPKDCPNKDVPPPIIIVNHHNYQNVEPPF